MMMVSEHLMQRLYQDIKHIADSHIPYDHKINWICVTSLKPNTFHGNYSCFSNNQYLRMTGINVIEVSFSFVSHKMPKTPLLSKIAEIKLKTRSSILKSKNTLGGKSIHENHLNEEGECFLLV